MHFVLRAAAAGLAAVTLVPAAAAAQNPYTVDFSWAPSQPTTSDTTILRASTTAHDVGWDLDGDGDVDAQGPIVEHRFETAGEHRVTVKASWPAAVPIERSATKTIVVQGPATATPTPTPVATATPESTPAPVITPAATPAPCPTTFTAGKLVATAACFTGSTAKTPVKLNGFTLTPLGGTSIGFETTRTGTLVKAANARVTFTVKGTPVTLFTGKLEYKLVGDKLTGVKALNAAVGGLKITGTPTVTLLSGAQSQIKALFALPTGFGGTAQPATLTPNTNNGIAFTIANPTLPGLGLSSLTVTFEGNGSWSVEAKGKHGPVTLKRLHFAVDTSPASTKCKAPGAKAAMCGELALTAGPSLLGAPALSLDGGFGLNLFDSKPSVLKANGKVKLVGMTLKDAEFEMRDTGYVGVKSKLELGWPGVATIKGSSSIEFQGTKFNGESKDQVCLEFIDYCLGAETLLSTKGIAACLTVDLFLGSWHPGFGVQWGKSAKLYWKGCDLAPYREAFASAASTGAKRVRFGKGLPGAVIAVTGANGAPRVAFVGPKGQRIETPVDDKPVGGKGFFLMKVPGENLTQLAIAKPSAGTWKVVPLDGTTIRSVKSAEGLAKPSVKAKLRKGKLHYTVKRIPGQVVRFTAGGKELGRAKGTRGTLRVKAKGPITALVEQNGALRDRIIVVR